ncbi:hypothetical protein KN815_16145 [Streptomyces sp. 4503]|uniref:Uncharacterized protein n=1 Tax=Streptomyces niphimycinicus TaxID=2842201 RepID=A0ABS6CF51_9ACTN|nr:hypothetical protein [Streptomyces niphimycinicus]MBU3865553.1 hypothetical protein [Streptomyces niphimycinicus]
MTTTDVAVPGQAGELKSVKQLDSDEEAAVRLRRARRVMKKPQQLAGLDPAEQLQECLTVLHAAEAKREGTVKEAQLKAGAVFFDTAGPYLMWIRDNSLYCLDDPGRTFERWLAMIWGYSPSQCYLFMDAVRVRIALGLAGSDEYAYRGTVLTTKHIRALAPAVNAELAAEDVQHLWADTEARDGKVTEEGLREAYRQLTAAKSAPDVSTAETTTSTTATDSNTSFDSSDRSEESNADPNAERLARWEVNQELSAIHAELERLQGRYSLLTDRGLAPLDAADAVREAKQIRALGRWFNQHGTVPVDAVVDAEIVEN